MREIHCDVVIAGTGMGGATLGLRLAEAGKRVLFLEKGRSHLAGNGALRGDYAEAFQGNGPRESRLEVLRRAGRASAALLDRSRAWGARALPFMGCGTGGSAALYGMVMQRFWPEDFTPRQNFPDAGEANLVESWPVGYEQLRPFYRQAEALFGVRGALDPLNEQHLDPLPRRPPPPRGSTPAELFEHFKSKGLRPYQPPLACELVPDCRHCQGFLCPNNCKNDAAKVCLEPALNRLGAILIDECEVLRLEAGRRRVRKVIARRLGETLSIGAETVVLAAGALATPAILLNSATRDWPQGLANASGLVGRNLMRNYYDLYLVFPKSSHGSAEGPKDLYLSDFYGRPAGKLGILQSFGRLSRAAVVEDWENALWANGHPYLVRLLRAVKPLLGRLLARRLDRAYVMVTTGEDLPYLENRIAPQGAGGEIAFHYRLGRDERRRSETFRRKLSAVFSPYRYSLLKQAEQNRHFIALACGTCRFGSDPERSVLDAQNRAHGIENLYVVDASFFPSNPGLNSGLTIAANALRVAEHLCSK